MNKMYALSRFGGMLAWMILLSISGFAQPSFNADLKKDLQIAELDQQFEKYDVFRLDMSDVNLAVTAEDYDEKIRLVIGEKEWTMVLTPNDLRAPNYVFRYNTSEGIKVGDPGPVSTYMGHLINGTHGTVRLSILDDLFYGYIKEGDIYYNIEPLWYFQKNADRDLFVIYRDKDVRPRPQDVCGVTEDQPKHIYELKEDQGQYVEGEALPMMECRELELAIAHDKYMYDKYGSESACENHAEAIMNLVQGNYDDEFNFNIQFIIVEQFVETNNINFPTSSNDAGTVLSAFRSWGNGNFTANHDLGQLWTARDFSGGTVGIAYLSAVCSFSRYHALQDYTSNNNQLRCMTSHEIGHNFSCTHDAAGSPTIMAPSVSGSNTWSAQSRSQVNNFTPGAGCLNVCFIGNPPAANFFMNPNEGCVPLTVQFQDQSTGPPDSWFWEFPGGVPNISTDQNPVVRYDIPGVYDVTLTVTNQVGQDRITIPGAVTVKGLPEADFFYVENQRSIAFNDASLYATTYSWDFGDGFRLNGPKGLNITPGTNGGRTTGTYDNPTHRYDRDGNYLVTLTVLGDCGSSSYTEYIEVVSDVTAEFVAVDVNGCAPFEVDFVDNSSENVTDWLWEFEGGMPATSTDQNPTVRYDSAGTFDVKLTVKNSRYTDVVVKRDYITVDTFPTAYFGDSTVNLRVFFKDSAILARNYKWYFGDGDSSTQRQPIHTYKLDTTYLVTQIVSNYCGFDTFQLLVPVGNLPSAGFDAPDKVGCPPLAVQFMDTSSANTTRWYWTFPGGNPASSRDRNPLVTYNTPGKYSVRLIAENGLGRDTVEIADFIEVEPLPIADFDFARNGYVVAFTNMSEYGNSYAWDFGDGNSSTEENPTHTYQADGTYTVVLEVTNDCGTTTKVLQITVSTAPSASFRSNATEGCVPFSVAFENRSSNNASSYQWTFPGGNPGTSTLENPVVEYAVAGVYDVTLIASNGNGSDTITEPMYIKAKDVPVVDFAEQVLGNRVQFANATVNGTSYLWNFGDGETSDEKDPLHTFSANGTYTVTLVATNDCGSSSEVRSVTITAYPTAEFETPATEGCAPLQVQFEDNSTNASSWVWSFPGATPSTSTDQNPVVVYNQRGTYGVSLTVTNQYGNSSVTKSAYITVIEAPEASFDAFVNGFDVEFINASVDGDSYNWDFGDGEFSNDEEPEHTYAEEGSYSVTLVVSNQCGSDTLVQIVEVVDNTPVITIVSTVTEGCVPYDVSFRDNSSNNPTSWNWTFEGGLPESSNEQNPTVRYTQPGVYDVILEVTNQFGTSMRRFEELIVALDVPQADFSADPKGGRVSFTNKSQFGTNYIWDFGDGMTSTDESPEHIYGATGDYTVTLIATNQCGSDTTTQSVYVNTTNVRDLLEVDRFEVYPNPSNGRFNVLIDGISGTSVDLNVINILGSTVYHQEAVPVGGYLLVDMDTRLNTSGVYYLQVRIGDKLASFKLVVQP